MAELPSANMEELDVIESIASSDADTSVLMINLNRYAPDAEYPDGQLYKDYMAKLHELVDQVNGKVLWRTSVHGQVVGSQELHEVLGIVSSHGPFESNERTSIRGKYEATKTSHRNGCCS